MTWTEEAALASGWQGSSEWDGGASIWDGGVSGWDSTAYTPWVEAVPQGGTWA